METADTGCSLSGCPLTFQGHRNKDTLKHRLLLLCSRMKGLQWECGLPGPVLCPHRCHTVLLNCVKISFFMSSLLYLNSQSEQTGLEKRNIFQLPAYLYLCLACKCWLVLTPFSKVCLLHLHCTIMDINKCATPPTLSYYQDGQVKSHQPSLTGETAPSPAPSATTMCSPNQ